MHTIRYLALLAAAPAAWATLIVENIITGITTSYPSAVYTFLSDREDEFFANYPVVFVKGSHLCNPTSDLVSGKIVLAFFESGGKVDCYLNEAAMECAELGAVAFVVIAVHNPPGLVANLHWTFSPESENIGIPILDIAGTDVEHSELGLWRSSMMDGMKATVGPPYVQIYSDLFESPLWLAVFQIILPGCALLVTAESITEIRRRSHSRMQNNAFQLHRGLPPDRTSLVTAPIIICAVEAATCFAIGFVFALGHCGPMYLPYAYHFFFNVLLTGSSFFTTVVLALIMHEKSKFVNGLPSHSDVSILYFKTIAACALICIGSDIVNGGLYGVWQVDLTSLYGIYGFGQVIVAFYFLSQARALYRPLLAYLNHPESNPRPENEAKLKYLAHNLTLSGTAMLLNTSSMIIAAVAFSGRIRATSGLVWFGGVFFFSASRIGVSYGQVSVDQNIHAQTNSLYCKCAIFGCVHGQVKVVSSYKGKACVFIKYCMALRQKLSGICRFSKVRSRVQGFATQEDLSLRSPVPPRAFERNVDELASDPLPFVRAVDFIILQHGTPVIRIPVDHILRNFQNPETRPALIEANSRAPDSILQLSTSSY